MLKLDCNILSSRFKVTTIKSSRLSDLPQNASFRDKPVGRDVHTKAKKEGLLITSVRSHSYPKLGAPPVRPIGVAYAVMPDTTKTTI